jgi:predicted RNase H-like HicB family nuclease
LSSIQHPVSGIKSSTNNYTFNLLINILLESFRPDTKYEIIIFWSEADNSYIADVPELPGCMAHGNTYESALANAKTAIEAWILTATEFGDPIPKPKGQRLVYA